MSAILPFVVTGVHMGNSSASFCTPYSLPAEDMDYFFAGAPIGLAEIDNNLRFLRVNSALAEIDGLSAAQHIGRSFSEVLPTLRTTFEPSLRDVLARGEAIEKEFTGEAANKLGEPRIWKVKLFPLRNWDDSIKGVGAVVEDITSKKSAEVELRESKERLRLFIERAPVGIAMFDTDMRYVAASRRFLTDRGVCDVSLDSVVGRCHYECFPNTPARWRDIHRRVFLGEVHSMDEEQYQRTDGTIDWIRWEMTPWWRPDGAIGGALLYSEIITARKEIEVALRESETLLRMSQEVGRIGSWDWDLTNDTIRGSDTQCLQFGIQPNGGRPLPHRVWSSKVYPKDLVRIEQQLQSLIESGDCSDAEYRIQGPNGLRWLYARCHVIRDSEGQATRMVGIDMDITNRIALQDDLRALTKNLELRVQEEVAAREAVQARLAHADKLKSVGELTGGIAHDFNNMLTVITGTIDILAEGVTEKPHLLALTDLIGKAADRAAQLTSNLLAFARKQPLRPQRVDVAELVAELRQLLVSAIGRKIVIEHISRADVELAYVDPVQLSSAIVNLAINGRDAMPDGGTLTLEIDTAFFDKEDAAARDCQSGRYTTIAVSDTGTGIPESIRPKIFEPFFTTKGVGKGTGLGLSTVFGFIKQSGGHLEMTSDVGVGTTFQIYLPTADRHLQQLDTTASTGASQNEADVILCVEDDSIVRQFVSDQLQTFGYRTIVASNGREAINVVDSETRVDLLFTDVIMPGGIDGWQLAKQVAKRRPALKVLFTTGYSDSITQHLGTGADILLLPKPYRSTELESMVRIALESKRLVQ